MRHSDEYITIIVDDQTVLNIKQAASAVIQGSVQAGLSISKVDQWVAVPVESALHFDDSDKQRLSHAIEEYGNPLIYGYALDDYPSIPTIISFNANYQGLDAFDRAFCHFNYALFPESMSWMLVCLLEDYYIVMGPVSFVERVLETTVENGYASFHTFAHNPGWPSITRERFLYVLQAFKEHYRMAKQGEHILL